MAAAPASAETPSGDQAWRTTRAAASWHCISTRALIFDFKSGRVAITDRSLSALSRSVASSSVDPVRVDIAPQLAILVEDAAEFLRGGCIGRGLIVKPHDDGQRGQDGRGKGEVRRYRRYPLRHQTGPGRARHDEQQHTHAVVRTLVPGRTREEVPVAHVSRKHGVPHEFAGRHCSLPPNAARYYTLDLTGSVDVLCRAARCPAALCRAAWIEGRQQHRGAGRTTPRGWPEHRGAGRTTPRGWPTTPRGWPDNTDRGAGRGAGRTTPRGWPPTPRGWPPTPRAGRQHRGAGRQHRTPRGWPPTPRGWPPTPRAGRQHRGLAANTEAGRNTEGLADNTAGLDRAGAKHAGEDPATTTSSARPPAHGSARVRPAAPAPPRPPPPAAASPGRRT